MPTTGSMPQRSSINFQGEHLAHDESMKADTGTHIIKFSRRERDQFVPDIRVEPKHFEDPDARTRISNFKTHGALRITNSATLKAFFREDLDVHRDYLIPDFKKLISILPASDRNKSAYLQVSGRRIEKFIDEWLNLVGQSGIRDHKDFSDAIFEINTAGRDLYADRVIEFPSADTRTYWSCSRDSVFVHVYELLLKHLPKDDPKREFHQAQIDHLLTYKYTPKGFVEPTDIEKSLQLVAIDKETRRVVSMTPETEESFKINYETLQVPSTNRTGHAGKFVVRDGRNYFLEGTREKIPPNVIRTLVRHPVEDVVLRRPLNELECRRGFKFDWSESGDFDRVETGWWGFCDGRASAEQKQIDMARSGGLVEVHPSTGSSAVFDRDQQMEAYASCLDFASRMVDAAGIEKGGLGVNLTRGERFYETPDTFALQAERGPLIELPVTVKSVSKAGAPDELEDVETLFMEKIPAADRESFSENTNAVVGTDGVTNYVSCMERKLLLEPKRSGNKGIDFNSSGELVPLVCEIAFDPTSSDPEPVLLGTHLVDADKKQLLKYEYHPDTGTLSKTWVEYRLGQGSYEPNVLQTKDLGRLVGSEMGRERMCDDHSLAKLEALRDAIRTGEKINVDSTWWKAEVWNGQATRFYIHTEFRDREKGYERLAVYMDARFAEGEEPGQYGRVGSYINRLDSDGNITESLELEPFCDFLWRAGERITPYLGSGRSRIYNRELVERGMLDPSDGPGVAVSAMWDLCDIMFLGIKEKTGKPFYSIPVEGPHWVNGQFQHESGRVIYRDRAIWQADLKAYRAELLAHQHAQTRERTRSATGAPRHRSSVRAAGRSAQPYPYDLRPRPSSTPRRELTGARASTASSRARVAAGGAASPTLGLSVGRAALHSRAER